ncbi:8-oxo-dGTP diphosphatase [Microbacterium gorillae]|uniref:8-oxo-dGTP diphosphatase n=1 Tax=Microbacterium gorillae TaxID=1231063 RepID=UPI000694E0A4|nr:NUDIX domain-containing protein [Microbacterium gorillae]
MPVTPMCLVFVVDTQSREVLLGMKHRGIGSSNIVGLGGHVDPGETAMEAAVREAREEALIRLDSAQIDHAGQIRFRFPAKPNWDQDVDVFVTTAWSGTPAPTAEITPRWYPLDDLPLDEMWDDARYWLQETLAGRPLNSTITFASDNKTVANVTTVAEA